MKTQNSTIESMNILRRKVQQFLQKKRNLAQKGRHSANVENDFQVRTRKMEIEYVIVNDRVAH